MGGCSPAAVLNAVAPSRLAARDISYGPRRLDVYAPPGEPTGAPVLVFFYGGSWMRGSKDMYRFVGGAYADAGFVTVVPDYRLYPEVRYPTFLEDCAAACAWARRHAAAFGGDASRGLFVMGHSAGAYNAVMLGLDGRWLEGAGSSRSLLAGVVGLAGPYDFLPLDEPDTQAVFGHAGDLVSTQPVAHVDGTSPPMMLATGLKDTQVRPRNTRHLAERIQASHAPVTVHEYPGIGHLELIGAVAAPLRFLAPVFRDSIEFMRGFAATEGGGNARCGRSGSSEPLVATCGGR